MEISLIAVFWAGLLSFFAPCVLPMYPIYLSYMTGMSMNELKEKSWRKQGILLIHSILFLIGFSTIFVVLGFSTSFLGNFMHEYERVIQIVSGLLLIGVGVVLFGKLNWSFLMKEKRWNYSKKSVNFFNSYFIGLSFGAGWTPCIGPVLAAVYSLTFTYPELSVGLILVYILGFSIPFIGLTFFVNLLNPLKKHMSKFQKISGILFVLMGFLLLSGYMDDLSVNLTKWFGNSWFE